MITKKDIITVKRGDIVRFKSYALRVDKHPMILNSSTIVLTGTKSTDGCPQVTKKFIGGMIVDVEEADTCPRCKRSAVLSQEPIETVIYTEALCDHCREVLYRESKMDAFDIAYERTRSSGWAD